MLINFDQNTTFSDACLEWLKASPKLSEATHRSYRGEIDRLAQYMASRFQLLAVAYMTVDQWREYISTMQESRRSIQTRRSEVLKSSSVRQAMRISRRFLIWCAEHALLTWWPPSLDVAKQDESDSEEFIPRQLPKSLHAVLSRDSGPLPLEDMRALFAMNLAYWAGLELKQLSALRVKNLVFHSRSRVVLILDGHDIQLPLHLGQLWGRYKEHRILHGGAELTEESPLLSHLSTEHAIRPWAIWSMINRWQQDNRVSHPVGPRMLRSRFLKGVAYLEARNVAVSLANMGKAQTKLRAANGDVSRIARRIIRKEVQRLAAS